MNITTTANRIINYSVIFMVCACLSLLAIGSYIPGDRQTPPIRKATNTTAKSAIATSNDLAHTKAGGEVKTEQVKSEAPANISAMEAAQKRTNEAALNDPDFRKGWINYNAKVGDKYYADLYKILKLDDSTSETLRELLADRSLAVGLVAASTDATATERVNERERLKSEYDEKIAVLLGPDKYAQLSEYETTLPERGQIMQFRNELEFSGEPLTIDQEAALLPAVESYVNDNPILSIMIQAQLRTDPMSTRYMVRTSADELDVLKEVLSPGQIESLAGSQKRRENLSSINYPWGSMGRQIRKSGNE